MNHRHLFRRRPPAVWVAGCLLLLCGLPRPGAAQAPPGDTGFALRHPRLFFSASGLPALRARVHDGGVDDAAYAFIRQRATTVYTSMPLDTLVSDDAAQEQIINLALASYFESAVDSALVRLGRRLTLYIARQYNVDTDPFGTSLRLRALAIGFDHFFVDATPAERDEIRTEAASYINYMTTNLNYDIWRHRPYVSNKTAMVSAALGLSAIAFRDELPASQTDAALAAADDFFQAWRDAHLANDGAYREGSLYATWSMRNLVYYFAARKRYDGFDYAQDPLLRALERWLPYELDPRGDGHSNNIQDQTDWWRPLARHSTYWAWAQSAWGSGIAAYMWDHCAGAFGHDMKDENDKASTVLWHTGVTPVNPGTVLPRSHVWEDRGLYYFRTGWPDGASSGDVVFSFYSGEFHGGHAQEDQNQFTLAGYGEKLVLDHGAGPQAKQSEAHNLVRIDGNGEYNAGSSIGTDGRIAAFITTDFADCVCGDATNAYTTHSPYNDPGVPYPWSNWSWGLYGANPVEHALRTVVAMHGPGAPPYFVIRDDILKDGATHHYDWCMHVPDYAAVDTTGDAVTVTGTSAVLRLYCVQPDRRALTVGATPFDGGNEDPDSRLVTAGMSATNPNYTMLLLPLPASQAPPDVTRKLVPGGAGITIAWDSGLIDEVRMRLSVTPGGSAARVADPFPWAIDTDAQLAVVRKNGPTVIGYTLADATRLVVGGVPMLSVDNGPASFVFGDSRLDVSRRDAHFRVRADAVSAVFCHDTPVPVYRDGDFLVNAVAAGVAPVHSAGLNLRSYPNPFNPEVHIAFVNPARGFVHATIHDAAGRLVATLASGVMDAGDHTLEWDGRDHTSLPAASGVYFLRLEAGGYHATRKLVLVR